MPYSESDVSPIICFMSYRRADNEVYRGVVDQLKSDLAGRFEAQTGRVLRIFVDRDDIGWGDDWRQRILDSIKTATFFIPIITARYFDSQPCRDEFTAFYEDAKTIGVTGLIRPIVLAGRDKVSGDSPNEQMRTVARLNYVSIEDEFDEGFDSPLWRKTIKYMVGELAKAIEEAENTLEIRETTAVTHLENSADSDDEDGAEVADLQALEARIEGVNEQIEIMTADMQAVTEALAPVINTAFWEEPKASQRTKLLAAANAIRQPAIKFAKTADLFESELAAVESGFRLTIDELGSMESDRGKQLSKALLGKLSEAPDFSNIESDMAPVIDGLRLLGMMNINMRKASQPVLRGIQSVKRGAEILQSLYQIARREEEE